MSAQPPLSVPFISQWDTTAHLSRGDCGVVAACMVALWMGIATTPDQMLQQAGLALGRHAYTFNEIVAAAHAVGLLLVRRPWSTRAIICAEVEAGRPVVTLLRSGLLSGNQDDGDMAHFVTVVGCTPDAVIIHDPNFWAEQREQGAARHIPNAEFEAAIGEALLATGNQAYQSLFVVP